ncbi:MAG: 30S ribosomal protein S8 [Candidatus Harrisonbacteria bacterium RIFCSPHIGHO2_01_FULL_44_13]|uniref:Small ribosomal subunit protein uS8 n=1 Tax=Candidatus Harrisonbacteria bacterium RIFCSPLOWO2_01_FULL_44_18 TaxID=1798407 RepID=A0A1G1ZMR8_9BACT|nr:MAG: 30S ribosomal protein S8 [Candidatus Harrisonbacteria bacterium RIFCSPHIGHO2_01_FULL_44_13]OGY65958.1 MAG: 30S ribosomal protein S8 [Candidatus Harrisonbacteria bacterium RIFCSPLOWO2_01_FULL_44_18]
MYTNVLTQLKNAQQAKKERIRVPYSKMDMAVLEVLAKSGYLSEASKKGRLPKRIIEIKLKYEDGKGVISGIKFVSKPSRKLYVGYKELRPVKQGYGLAVISTSKGIMTAKEARNMKLGGEVLFEIF